MRTGYKIQDTEYRIQDTDTEPVELLVPEWMQWFWFDKAASCFYPSLHRSEYFSYLKSFIFIIYIF